MSGNVDGPEDGSGVSELTLFPGEFSVTVSRAAKAVVVGVDGELDLATAPALEATLTRFRGRVGRFAFDLAGVSFIDLAGLRPIAEQCHTDGVSHVLAASRRVRRLLQLFDLESLVVGGTGKDSAVAAFGPVSQSGRLLA